VTAKAAISDTEIFPATMPTETIREFRKRRDREHLLLGERPGDEDEIDRQADDDRARDKDQVRGDVEARRSLHHGVTPSSARAAR
jgi:hypothetical protein